MLVVSAPQDAVLSKDVHTLLITAVTAVSNLTYINSKALSDACTQLTPLFQVLSVAKLNPVVSEIFLFICHHKMKSLLNGSVHTACIICKVRQRLQCTNYRNSCTR